MSEIVIPSKFFVHVARPKGIILDPLPSGHGFSIHGRVCAVILDPDTGETRDVIETKNIVTNAGDLYYAQRSSAETPTNFTSGSTFDGIMELYTATGSAAPAKGNDRSDLGTIIDTGYAMDSGYPKTNDADSDNTGAGTDVISYLRTFSTSQGNGSDIDDVIITNPSPGASEAILMHASFGSPFTKTATDTLKVFVNHTMNGT